MAESQRVIKKQLIVHEDILQGVGKVQQQRGSSVYDVHMLDLPVPTYSVVDMQASDAVFVRLYASPTRYTDFRRDPDAVAGGIPSSVQGRWLAINPDIVFVGSFLYGAYILDEYSLVYNHADGLYYSYNGTVPYFLPPGTALSASFTEASAEGLRGDLAADSGAAQLGTSRGSTVEAELTTLAADVTTLEGGKAALAGSASQAFKVAKASNLNEAAPLSQVKALAAALGCSVTQVVAGLQVVLAAKTLEYHGESLANGTPVSVDMSADYTLTVPNGATLGLVSGEKAKFLVVTGYNSGSPVLGIVKANSGLDLTKPQNISLLSGSSNSGSLIYGTAAVTSTELTIEAEFYIQLATAGQWVSNPTNVNTFPLLAKKRSRKMLSQSYSPTTGTALLITDIPDWANKITVHFDKIRLSAVSSILLQIGQDTLLTSGYVAGSGSVSTSTADATGGTSTTAGHILRYSVANQVDASAELKKLRNSVVGKHTAYISGINAVDFGYSSVPLVGAIKQLNITTVGGTATFVSGSIILEYEE